MSNGLTADWDLMQAINVSTVNTAIATELKAAGSNFPTSFSVAFTDPVAGATTALSGSFSAWSIQSGTGQNITFQADLAFTTASITEGDQDQPIPLTTYQGYSLFALITIDQLYFQQAQANNQALRVAPKTQVLGVQVMGLPTSGPAPAPQPISIIDYANGDHLQDAFASWCQNSLPSELAYAFLVMNEARLAFPWATPTTASYSVNFPIGAGDGVFAQYSMTENRSSNNPYPVVQSDAVPGGSNGVLCLSTDRFLQKVMINALAQQFFNASAGDFAAITEPGSTMATGLTNNGTLTLPDMQLDNGDTVNATIPAGGVSLSVVGNQIVIELNGLTFECPDILGIIPSGVHVTLNYSCTANLVLSNGALSLANVTHSLSYSVTFATVYTVLNVVIGVLTVVFALLGLAGTIQAARAAATQAAQAAQVTTNNAVNAVGGSIEMTSVSLANTVPAELVQSIGNLSAIQRSGSALSEGELAELRTIINDIGGSVGTARSVSCGYITRIMGRLLLLAVAGYGAYRYVSFNLTGSFVQILEDGDPVDPPTLEDFSSELLKPVTWTNVNQNWSVNGATLNDGVQIDLVFASSPAPAPVST